jgi:hypothetical protein
VVSEGQRVRVRSFALDNRLARDRRSNDDDHIRERIARAGHSMSMLAGKNAVVAHGMHRVGDRECSDECRAAGALITGRNLRTS